MTARGLRLLATAALLIALSGCAGRPDDRAGMGQTGQDRLAVTNGAAPDCTPTDQDQYIYRPARLPLLEQCIRVTGTVMDVSESPGVDGDMEMKVRLDAPYQSLLTPGNRHLKGNLQVEAICQIVPPLIEAIRVCASDPDPYPGPYPHVGDHIWIEGRYTNDLGHYAWAELHPLYRWGPVNP